MTAASFPIILPFTLREEGGYVLDQGGPTYRGITLATYRIYAREPLFTAAQLRALTPVQVAAFYGVEWNKVQGDGLPDGVDAMVFDHFVNAGTHSASILQRVVGLTGNDVDGWIGPGTLAAVRAVNAGHLALKMLPAGTRLFQGALGILDDGKVGPQTARAMASYPALTLVSALLDAQGAYYHGCDDFARDGAGWMARLGRRATLAATMAKPAMALQAPIS